MEAIIRERLATPNLTPTLAATQGVLKLRCPDRMGLVHAVSGFLLEHRCNITESRQYSDSASSQFFMRVQFQPIDDGQSLAELRSSFGAVAAKYNMEWQIENARAKIRTLVMVSRYGHCLSDLLFRAAANSLQVEIPVVVSNHPIFERLVTWYGSRFEHLPVNSDNKADVEARLLRLIDRDKIELVVLARYMQVLSPLLCHRLTGRAINIHHSFLPAFKGAQPYQQAFDRGVKVIGATAHYVTEDLDEGPIIEQDVARVDHSMDSTALATVGQDIEALTLARAVQLHADHRVFLNGRRTVVLR